MSVTKQVTLVFLSFIGLLSANSAHASWQFHYLTGNRGQAVFDAANSEKASPFDVLFLTDKAGRTGREWGALEFEVSHRTSVSESEPYFLRSSLRVGSWQMIPPVGIWPNQSGPIQSSIETQWDLGFEYDAGRFGVRVGPRVRYMFLESGLVPSNGQAGLALAFLHRNAFLRLELEAALMAVGIGGASLGVQRDASSLRVAMIKPFMMSERMFEAGVEFYHHHRSFYGANLSAGSDNEAVDAYFLDDVQLKLVFGVEL